MMKSGVMLCFDANLKLRLWFVVRCTANDSFFVLLSWVGIHNHAFQLIDLFSAANKTSMSPEIRRRRPSLKNVAWTYTHCAMKCFAVEGSCAKECLFATSVVCTVQFSLVIHTFFEIWSESRNTLLWIVSLYLGVCVMPDKLHATKPQMCWPVYTKNVCFVVGFSHRLV